MALKAKIQQDLSDAVRKRDEIRTSVFRMLLASLFNKEKEKRYKIYQSKKDISEKELNEKSQLTDEEAIEVISSEIKKGKKLQLSLKKGKGKNWQKRKKGKWKF